MSGVSLDDFLKAIPFSNDLNLEFALRLINFPLALFAILFHNFML